MLESILKEKYGIDAVCLEETDSTNLVAKRLAAEGCAEWTTVIARRQTGGRGRLGRQFYSPEGGLYMSVVLRPDDSPENALLITTAAAAAVSRAIDDCFAKQTAIKWVNDIILDGKKVCGILAESALLGDRTAFTVFGVGVNLYGDKNNIPDELKSIMGFIENTPCSDEQTAKVIGEILKNFKEYYVNLRERPHFDIYKQKMLFSDNASVVCGERCENAKILSLADDFSLIVKTERGREKISFGEVSIRL